jgi:predicted enzyme related to lactoylglutathione lyase
MIYITVDDLEQALQKCVELGGKILKPSANDRPYAIIEDPAGAVCTLYQAQ